MTRDEAAAAGLKRYSPAVPCPAGHVCDRYVGCNHCVECAAENRKKYRATNKATVLEAGRQYAERKRETLRRQALARRNKNIEKAREQSRRWRLDNPDKARESRNKRRVQNNDSNRRRRKERRPTDPLFALQCLVRSRLTSAFRAAGYAKNGRTAQLVGCSWGALKRHIERQFLKGMTWENRGTVWHVDHIVPFAEADTAEEVAALCHFSNLRPLWAKANQEKSGKRTHLI